MNLGTELGVPIEPGGEGEEGEGGCGDGYVGRVGVVDEAKQVSRR